MTETVTKPSIEERYQTASNAKNLKVSRLEDRRTGDAEMLIAAGWSPVKLGMALMRLQSEWDGVEHPRRMGEDQMRVLAAKHLANAKTALGEKPLDSKGAMRIAFAESSAWYTNELALMRLKLKTMPMASSMLEDWCRLHGVDPEVGMRGLRWWLDHTCRSCDGRRFEKVPDQPALSHKRCKPCRGTGKILPPDGKAGSRIQCLLDDCKQRGQASIRMRLRSTHNMV